LPICKKPLGVGAILVALQLIMTGWI